MVLLHVFPLWQENVEFLTDEFKNPKYTSYFVCKSTSVVCSLARQQLMLRPISRAVSPLLFGIMVLQFLSMSTIIFI